MDLPKAVQGVSETVRWPEFTELDFCNEEWNKYFHFFWRMNQHFNDFVNEISLDFILNSGSNILLRSNVIIK